MRGLLSFIVLTCTLCVAQQASAMDAMHGSMMMPTCHSGDPIVGVNTKTKMYMSHDEMKMKMAGMSDAKKHQMMAQNHVKVMCKSKADAMGARMMSGKM